MEPHERALIILAQVDLVDIQRIMIDNGSSMDILYSHAYQRVDLKGRKMEVGQETPLHRFSNDLVNVVETIELLVTFDKARQ